MSLLSLIFPGKCIFCGRLLKGSAHGVCDGCMDEIAFAGEAERGGGDELFDAAVSALAYEGKVREALHRFKFSGKQSYAAPLARILAFALENGPGEPCDIIIPVPTNRENVRKRGYNHAALLARELSRLIGVPSLEALGKIRRTRPMFGLGIDERRANVQSAFALLCAPEKIRGKRVLLVDDVITTGATLSACAGTLKEAGAEKVFCAAVAQTPKKNV